jgi:hypothetical protein
VLEEKTRHDAVRVAAMRSKIDAAFQRFELMQAMGWVPPPQVIHWEQQLHELTTSMAEILERHGVPDEAICELIALAERKRQ